MTKLFTVFGATGNQGGWIIQAVLTSETLKKEYKVRGVTRNPASASAKALESRGVEIVQADLHDPKSVQKAVEGSAVVFGMTNAWDRTTGGSEAAQGKAIADAAAAAGVELFFWSSLPSKRQIDETGNCDIKLVPHFEAKAEVERYIRESLPRLPSVFVHPAFFLDNFLSPGMGPSLGKSNDSLVLRLPFSENKAKLPLYTPRDMGVYITALLLAPRQSVIGRQWFLLSDLLTPRELANCIGKATGKHVDYEQLTIEQYEKSLPENIAEELGANMRLVEHPGYYGSEKAAREGLNGIKALIEKTGAGKLTDTTDFFRNTLCSK